MKWGWTMNKHVKQESVDVERDAGDYVGKRQLGISNKGHNQVWMGCPLCVKRMSE